MCTALPAHQELRRDSYAYGRDAHEEFNVSRARHSGRPSTVGGEEAASSRRPSRPELRSDGLASGRARFAKGFATLRVWLQDTSLKVIVEELRDLRLDVACERCPIAPGGSRHSSGAFIATPGHQASGNEMHTRTYRNWAGCGQGRGETERIGFTGKARSAGQNTDNAAS